MGTCAIELGTSPTWIGPLPSGGGSPRSSLRPLPSRCRGSPSRWGWLPTGRGRAHLDDHDPHLKQEGSHLEGAEPPLQGGMPAQLWRSSQSVRRYWRTLTRQPSAAEATRRKAVLYDTRLSDNCRTSGTKGGLCAPRASQVRPFSRRYTRLSMTLTRLSKRRRILGKW